MMFCNQNYKFGVIPKKDGFMIRLALKPGYITSEQLDAISYIAKNFGENRVHITTRQGIELKIKFEHLEEAEKMLNDVGIKLGSTGRRIRQIVSCIGTECPNSVGDSIKLARMIHDEFEGIWVPKKLKINVSGCPNNCTHHQFCDIGICFRYILKIDKKECIECGKCRGFCEIDAIDWENKIIKENCIGMGECLKLCNAIKVEDRVISIFIGGKGGKFPKKGKWLVDVKTENEVLDVIDGIIELYTKFGKGRVCDFVEHFGIENIKKSLKEKGFI
jgi:dissimilatory sulfite reductase (desulfoviridin) alpha/beta subunit